MSFKVGFVKYLNSWPLYNGLETALSDFLDYESSSLASGKINQTLSKLVIPTFGTPAEICEALELGLLDYAQLPSYEYLLHKDKFELFDQFCISTKNKSIKSVLFFSQKPINQLSGETIFFTDHSRTSVNLLKVLLKESKVSGTLWLKESVNCQDLLDEKFPNLLIIGDEALLAWQYKEQGKLTNYYCYDLADEWFKLSGLNFVFAVFVGKKLPPENKEFSNKDKEKNILKTSLKENLDKNLTSLALNEVQFNSKIEHKLIIDYLKGIQYSLDAERQTSLETFAGFL